MRVGDSDVYEYVGTTSNLLEVTVDWGIKILGSDNRFEIDLWVEYSMLSV